MILFLFLFLFSWNAYASDCENYIGEKPDGSIRIACYLPGSEDSLEEFFDSVGFTGLTITKIDASDIPTDKSTRDYWRRSFVGKKIAVDTAKKKSDDEAKAAMEAQANTKKDEALAKLSITEDEFKNILYGVQK